MAKKLSQKHFFRAVISAEMESGGTSIFPNAFGYFMPLGNVWTLKLECGHVIHKQPVYYPLSKEQKRKRFGRRNPEDAKPAPKRVHCPKCAYGYGIKDDTK